MNPFNSVNLMSVTVLLATSNITVSQEQVSKPNIIIILADDLGYSDPGCYGGEINTPAIDKLAYEGVRFTRFQNSAMCICSRASLLTGNYWPKAIPGFDKMELLPEMLRESGYRTALIGKWHLPGDPMDRGFDHFFGFLGGFSDHFKGSKDYRLNREPFTAFGSDYYSSDVFTDRAIKFIQSPNSGQTDQPFFLYLSYQAPHNPLQAPKADIIKQRGNFAGGWQKIREARFNRQKEIGIVNANTKLPDYPENLPLWESLTPEQRDMEDLRMSVYAAMVERMDVGIGRLLKALKDSGKEKNTLILFMSDNGTDPFSVMDEAMLKQEKLPGDPGSNWQPGTGWAYAANTPWRLYKISQHGGGVTTGAVVWWPGNTGKFGRIEHSAVHVIDVLPTIKGLLKQKAGADIAGESFLPLLKEKSWERKNPLYFQFMDNRAVRTSEWTLVEVDENGWELFDTRTDPTENINLVLQYPDIAHKLQEDWLKWWLQNSGDSVYKHKSTKVGPHYKPQGDRGSGVIYKPTAMPENLKDRYPITGSIIK